MDSILRFGTTLAFEAALFRCCSTSWLHLVRIARRLHNTSQIGHTLTLEFKTPVTYQQQYLKDYTHQGW